jgi:N-acetylmuramoyl-L-alanine amidase
MLKHTSCPLVIVECGYLSNRRESELLIQEEYQEKMAWAIHLGILEYINKTNPQ